MTTNSRKKKKKRDQSTLEKEFFRIMEQSLKSALDMALDEAIKDLNRQGTIEIKL